MNIRSPAKINLFLEILRQREDGYHEIKTVFQRIGFYDEITLEEAESGIDVFCDHPAVPPGDNNLAVRAAKLLQAESGRRQGVRITVGKRIPVGGGLGGGSSNAASVLLGLNRLWKLDWERARLLELGARLGADVPFFVSGCSTATGEGRGERLTGFSFPDAGWWVVLVNPGFELLTRDVYREANSRLTERPADVTLVLQALKEKNLAQLEKQLFNRLEEPAEKRCGEIQTVRRALKKAGARCVLMSGSGPTVFGIAGDRKEAIEIGNKLAGDRWQVWTARFFDNNEYD